MTALLDTYREYIEKLRAKRVPLIGYACPNAICGKRIELAKPGRVRDLSLSALCPYCGQLHNRFQQRDASIEAVAVGAPS